MNTSSPIRVYIVDDHEVVRGGLKSILESASDLEVVGEASNGREAVDAISTLKPDVAMLDISMPDLNGIDVIRLLRQKELPTRVIVFSMHALGEFVSAAMAA